MKKINYKVHFVSALVVSFFIFIAFGSNDDKKTDSGSSSSTETIITKDQTPAELKKQLKKELASFDKPFDGSSYRGTVESLQMEVVLFSLWASVIDKGANSMDKENKKLAAGLKRKVIARQVKEFPKIRGNYGKALADKLWESNIYASTEGHTNGIINLTGGIFANNKNIAETQQTLLEVFTQFRFKEVRYRWYKGADEFTYYKLETPKDSEVIEISK
jgi:hypothetical protein